MDNKITETKNGVPQTLYKYDANIGTEEVTQEDFNTPMLKIIQPNTQEIPDKKDGAFYRTDTKEQLESVEVNLVYVTTKEVENYNKTGIEKVKIYFGFYKGTNEPFRMYFRGWLLADHRNFQTEVISIKNRYKVPMLALTVRMTTYKQTGVVKESGKPYTSYRPLLEVEKIDGVPVFEQDEDRVNFLVEAANRFKDIASLTSDSDDNQNEIPQGQTVGEANDLPFD